MKLTQKVDFDACHRLYGYNGNCQNCHGHTWQVELTIDSDQELNKCDMLLDYREIKQWFKDTLDHCAILNEDDPLVPLLKSQKCKVTTLNGNPTAENLAKFIAGYFNNIIATKYVSVIVHESKDNSAEYEIRNGGWG